MIHAAVHAARPDVIAAAHAHSVYGKVFSSLGRELDPITQDACVFFEDHPVLVTEGGGSESCSTRRAAAYPLPRGLGDKKAAIHQNHGLFTVGQSVDEAAWWFITMERTCQAQLLAEAAGTPLHVNADDARYTRAQTGPPRSPVVLLPAPLGRHLAQRARSVRVELWASPARAIGGPIGGMRRADCPPNENVF